MQARKLLAGLVIAALLPACASLPAGQQRDPRDRFERTNRAVYKFNDALDRGVAKPVAKTYVKITPQPVRTGLSNFWGNLGYSTTVVNDLLQAKGNHFFKDTLRLIVNTTLGIGGLFDPATQMGLKAHDEDFGQTLGKWGVPPGPYIVLPLLGPSDVRDAFGRVADHFTVPDTYLVHGWPKQLAIDAASLLDTRASLLGTDDLLTKSYDPYAFMRNAYLQRRQFLVTDGKSQGADDVEIFEDDAPADDASGSAKQPN